MGSAARSASGETIGIVGAGHPAPLLGGCPVGDRGDGTVGQLGRREHGDRAGSGPVEPGAIGLLGDPLAQPSDIVLGCLRQRRHRGRVEDARGDLVALQRVDGGMLVRGARPGAGREQQHRAAVQGVAAGGDHAQAGGGEQPARGRDAVVGEVAVPQGIPLPVAQGGGERRELQKQHAVVGQRVRSGPQADALVAVVHQPVDVDDDARTGTPRRTEATRQQCLAPGAAMRARELDEVPRREQARAEQLVDGLVRLSDGRARLDRSWLVRGGAVVLELGEPAPGAPPHGQRVARVRPRVRGGREVVGGRLVAQIEDDLAARRPAASAAVGVRRHGYW